MTRRGRSGAGPEVWRLGEGRRPGGPHLAVIPGAEAPLLPLDLPDKLQGMARERVARRMLADRLAGSLDGLELRPFVPKGAKAWVRVLVGDAARLQAARAQLSSGCLGLVPDYAALPCVPGVWTLMPEGGAVLARLGVGDGFAAEPELARVLLEEAAEGGRPAAVLRLGDLPGPVAEALAALGAPVFDDAAALAKAGHGKPLRSADAIRGLDLIDPPSAVFDRLRARVAAWRWPVVFAALALAAWLGNLWVETRALQEAAARDAQSAREMVRQHFVPAGPILDIRAQVASALATASTETASGPEEIDPLLLFQAAAPFFDTSDIVVETAAYGRGSGLVVSARAVDFQSLDFVVADLRDGGFLVEVLESTSRTGGGVTGRLRLQQAGG